MGWGLVVGPRLEWRRRRCIHDLVYVIAVSGANVYAGGNFNDAAGIAEADHVARWNGSAWSALGSNGSGDGAITGDVRALLTTAGGVYVGGGFWNAAGIPEADSLAYWNGSAWSAIGSNGAGDGVFNLAVRAIVLNGSTLYAAGDFSNAGGIAEADYVAQWNGAAWSALGSNGAGNGALNHSVYDLELSGSDLYASGSFTDAAGIAAADRVARWNGSAWSALGSDGAGNGALDGDAYALAVSSSSVFAGGAFNNAAGIAEADKVAAWSDAAPPALPTLSLSNATSTEGSGGGARSVTFTVTLSQMSSTPITVNYETSDGTANSQYASATAPDDYYAISQTQLWIPANTLSVPLNVNIKRDGLDEPDERLFVDLSSPSGATIADGRGVLKILDDDDPPVISIGDSAGNEGTASNGSTTPFPFSLTLSAPSGKTISVDVYSVSYSAHVNDDYVNFSGTHVVFAPGQTTATMTAQIKRDGVPEGTETFGARLLYASNVTLTANYEGTGTITDDDAPTGIVSAGSGDTCAIKINARLACWGTDDYFGQVAGPNASLASFTQVATGYYLTCGLKVDGHIKCWGQNFDQQVSGPNSSTGTFSSISVGGDHVCALKTNGQIKCWGNDYKNKVSDPNNSNATFTEIAAGDHQTCGLTVAGHIKCWGLNLSGEVADANLSSATLSHISAGYGSTCGIKLSGELICWGANGFGQRSGPNASTANFVQVSSGYALTCGLAIDGHISCWGRNESGQVAGPNASSGLFMAVAAGAGAGYGHSHTCALKLDGTLVCWGNDLYGQVSGPNASTSKFGP